MKSFFSVLLLGLGSLINLPAAVLEYQLLPDSTITSYNGLATGPSGRLSGTFVWVPAEQSGIVDSLEFNLINLSFNSFSYPFYSLTLAATAQPDNITAVGPDGGTAVNAIVNWHGAEQNPYEILGLGGSYLGPAAAPTELFLTNGLYPDPPGSQSSTLVAYLHIHARLVAAQPLAVFTTLASFDGTNGAGSYGTLLRGPDGSYYGTTYAGGHMGLGNVFKVTPAGKITSVVEFNGTNGAGPWAGLIRGSDGNFYGTTVNGGPSDAGTVFRLSPRGKLTTLVSFNFANGGFPYAGLVEGRDGYFYGTAATGGQFGQGTIFKISVLPAIQ